MVQENLPRPTVLVVDDEALIRWALSEGLTEAGYPVAVAATGAEARAWLTAHEGESCAVLLDLRLPDVADWSLLQHIREHWPDVPVVMMTAHGSADDALAAAKLGAYRFISKPFDVPELVRVVGEAWANSGRLDS